MVTGEACELCSSACWQQLQDLATPDKHQRTNIVPELPRRLEANNEEYGYNDFISRIDRIKESLDA